MEQCMPKEVAYLRQQLEILMFVERLNGLMKARFGAQVVLPGLIGHPKTPKRKTPLAWVALILCLSERLLIGVDRLLKASQHQRIAAQSTVDQELEFSIGD